MKFLPLVWSGLWRKPVRTALIFLQVTVAFALFGVLQGMKTGVDEAVAKVRADVLTVLPGVGGEAPLPLADVARLKSIPGVKEVTYADILIGTYPKPPQFVGVFSIVPNSIYGFRFHLAVTLSLALVGIIWALCMGLIGGLLPAVRAARVPVTVALRAT